MTTLAEQLKTLSTPELEKLERAHSVLASVNCDFDAALTSLDDKRHPLSQSDADRIASKSYELVIYDGLDPATARKQAEQEFLSGDP
jgi:hypothetical protein